MKVCVIDDNESITKLVSKFLEMKGHESVIINSGREGLDILEKEDFDAVVLDLAMPDFSGDMILDGLNKSGRITNHRICVFTASSTTDAELQKLKDNGALRVLKKPLDLPKLVSTLEEIKNSK